MAIDTTDQIVQARVRNSLLKIANQKPGQSPGDDKTGDNRHDKDWPPPAPLKPKLAHTPHTPESTYDDYGRGLKIAPYKGGNPGGQQIEIPWMKEEYKKKHPELEKLHNEKYHPLQIGMNYPPPSKLDKWLQLYQRNGGSLRHLDPDMRKLILQRGTMKAKGFDLGGGRSLGMPEIRALRGIFQGASEAERNKLIEKYSNRPFKGLV